jgi:hypothetical protein
LAALELHTASASNKDNKILNKMNVRPHTDQDEHSRQTHARRASTNKKGSVNHAMHFKCVILICYRSGTVEEIHVMVTRKINQNNTKQSHKTVQLFQYVVSNYAVLGAIYLM